MSGIVSAALTDKLAELEQGKAQTEAAMQKLEQRKTAGREVTVDPFPIPQEHRA